jgi:hypothetical protein
LHTALADPRDLRPLAVFEPPLFAAGTEVRPLLGWPGQSHFVTMTAPALVADALRQFFAEVTA